MSLLSRNTWVETVAAQESGVEVQQEGLVRVMRCWGGGEVREETPQEKQRRRGRSRGSLGGSVMAHCSRGLGGNVQWVDEQLP